MLPLSDRVLLNLRASPHTAKELAEALKADVGNVHRVLRGLDVAGIVEQAPTQEWAAVWRLKLGVEVEFHPSKVVVRGAEPEEPDAPRLGDAGRCRAVGRTGKQCRLPAAFGGLCFRHAQWGAADRATA